MPILHQAINSIRGTGFRTSTARLRPGNGEALPRPCAVCGDGEACAISEIRQTGLESGPKHAGRGWHPRELSDPSHPGWRMRPAGRARGDQSARGSRRAGASHRQRVRRQPCALAFSSLSRRPGSDPCCSACRWLWAGPAPPWVSEFPSSCMAGLALTAHVAAKRRQMRKQTVKSCQLPE